MMKRTGYREYLGLDGSGRTVWLDEVPLDRTGRSCGLFCPDCGAPLMAVRKSKDEPGLGFSKLSHGRRKEPGGCAGAGPRTLALAARSMLADMEGCALMLPPVRTADASPHVPRALRGKRPVRLPGLQTPLPDICIGKGAHVSWIAGVDGASRDARETAGPVVVELDTDGKALRVALRFYVGSKSDSDGIPIGGAGVPEVAISLDAARSGSGIDVDALYCALCGCGGDMGGCSFREWLWFPRARDMAASGLHLKVVSTGCAAAVPDGCAVVYREGRYSLLVEHGAPMGENESILNIDNVRELVRGRARREALSAGGEAPSRASSPS